MSEPEPAHRANDAPGFENVARCPTPQSQPWLFCRWGAGGFKAHLAGRGRTKEKSRNGNPFKSSRSCFFFQFQFTFNIILCWFQVYSVVVRRACALQSGPPGISSPHLAPGLGTTVLLTISPLLPFTSPRPFCNCQSVPLSPFTFPPALSALATTSLFSVSVSLFLFCLFICVV